MVGIPHLVTGAALGKALRSPEVALPAALASHFVLDWTPHLDWHAVLGRHGQVATLPEFLAGCADGAVGIALVLWLTRGESLRPVMLWGAFFAMLPDIVDIAANLAGRGAALSAWPGTAWLEAFHHGIQHNLTIRQWPLAIATQVAIVVAGILAIRCPPAAPGVR